MAIPDSFLDELRARSGLVELVGRRVKLTRRGREHTGLCPFHNEKTPSFTVSEDKGFYHCFGCGAHGGAIDFVMQTEGLSFPEAVERLAIEAGMEVPRGAPRDQEAERRRKSLYDVLQTAAEWFEGQLAGLGGQAARDYLQRRGLSEATAARFRLGLAPERRDALKAALLARQFDPTQLVEAGLLVVPEDGGDSYDRFRHRLIFPIADSRGRIVAFGGRALGEQRAKYLNSPETPVFHKGDLLYNLANARKPARDRDQVIVVEGYMDVIALDQAGFANAVAPLGTALTEAQLGALWRLSAEPSLCFDGDAAGLRAAYRAAERALPLLRPGHSLRFIELPEGEDPDSLVRGRGAAAFTDLADNAAVLADLLWRMHAEGRRLDTPERRAGLRQELRAMVGRISDQTVRGYYGEHFKAKLDAAFGPPARRGAAAGRPGGGGVFADVRIPARHGLGRGEAADTLRRERLLIAALLNHPELIHQVFEDLGELRLGSPELDNIRRAIIEMASSGVPLDLDGLCDNFHDGATARLIEELTGPGIAKLDPFARPDMALARVVEDWTSVYRLHRLSDLRRDLRLAEEELSRDMTEENLARFSALREAVEEAASEAVDITD